MIHAYSHMYIYIYIYVYGLHAIAVITFMQSFWLGTCMYVYVCVCMCMYVYVGVRMCMYVYVCVYGSHPVGGLVEGHWACR